MPFTKPHEPCNWNQLLTCCQCSPLLTSAIPFPNRMAKKLFEGLIVLLPFLRGHVFLVSSFLYNLMSDFLFPSPHLSETFLLDRSDLFSILSEILSGLKVSHPHLQLSLSFHCCLCKYQNYTDLFCWLLPASLATRQILKSCLDWVLTCLCHMF